MQAPSVRRWRGQVVDWIGRLGASGFPEASIAVGLFLYFEVFTLPAGGDRTLEFTLNVLMCMSAGIVGRWPAAGTIGAGAALALMIAFPPGDQIRFSALAAFVPLVSTGVRGLSRLCNVASIAYFVLLTAMTLPVSGTPLLQLESAILWGLFIGLARLASSTVDRLRRESKAQAELRVDALRHQRRGIAHDLHDTVAYSTTTMIMRAEQMKLRATDPGLIADLDFIITTGRRSVRDLRSMMETLRRNDPELDTGAVPMWRLVKISDVITERVAELAAHGLDLQVSVPDTLDDLPESVRDTVGKLVVEATSNMVKHAAPGPCRILIEIEDGTVEAVFTNLVDPDAAPGEGLGLLGAAARVETLGGELEATEASGTWIVSAQLPVGE